MGFLEQAERLRQAQRQEEQTKIELRRRQEAEKQVEQEALEKDKKYAPEDNRVICELISNLPEFNIQAYMEVVKKQTGYQGWPFLYTRDESLTDPELTEKLLKVGLRPRWTSYLVLTDSDCGGFDVEYRLGTIHPSKMFHGYDVKPQIGSWFSRTNLAEPQEPGIGLYFWKLVEKTSEPLSRNSYLSITITDNVFVRFVLPARAIITGDGRSINVTSLEVFDDALEQGFMFPHRTRIGYPQPIQTHIG